MIAMTYTPESVEEQEFLAAYDPSKFPITVVTVDNIVTRWSEIDDLGNVHMEVLLIKRGNWPYKGCWALPGGFIDKDETTERAALRELKEEAGLTPSQVKFVMVADKPDRDPRGRAISHVFRSHFDNGSAQAFAGDDAVEARWFRVSEAEKMDLAFDHREILERAL